ncbi:PREDICTED: nuclear transcription factor Y subunit B-6-like [Lupinus angustifolius]|nr:PREDICTED: nuclear transcription factor Y subunit B-6-like [Lupinus angustifolius]
MKKVLPPRAIITDQAKEAIVACTNEFIGFITMEANDICLNENRSIITAQDLLFAMDRFGFDNYFNILTLYLHRYRQNVAAASLLVTNMPPPHLSEPPLLVQPTMPQMGNNVITHFHPFTFINRHRFFHD